MPARTRMISTARISRNGWRAWWIGPTSEPGDLGSMLEDYGFQPARETPGMAPDLDMLAALLAELLTNNHFHLTAFGGYMLALCGRQRTGV